MGTVFSAVVGMAVEITSKRVSVGTKSIRVAIVSAIEVRTIISSSVSSRGENNIISSRRRNSIISSSKKEWQ